MAVLSKFEAQPPGACIIDRPGVCWNWKGWFSCVERRSAHRDGFLLCVSVSAPERRYSMYEMIICQYHYFYETFLFEQKNERSHFMRYLDVKSPGPGRAPPGGSSRKPSSSREPWSSPASAASPCAFNHKGHCSIHIGQDADARTVAKATDAAATSLHVSAPKVPASGGVCRRGSTVKPCS